jgi:hypothetical protein
MSVFHLSDIGKMIRRIATLKIIPNNFCLCNPKRGCEKNPIDAMTLGLTIEVVLGGRFVALGVKRPPGVTKAATRTGQFLVNGRIRGLIEVPHQDQGLVFFLKKLPNETGTVIPGLGGDVIQVCIDKIKPELPVNFLKKGVGYHAGKGAVPIFTAMNGRGL